MPKINNSNKMNDNLSQNTNDTSSIIEQMSKLFDKFTARIENALNLKINKLEEEVKKISDKFSKNQEITNLKIQKQDEKINYLESKLNKLEQQSINNNLNLNSKSRMSFQEIAVTLHGSQSLNEPISPESIQLISVREVKNLFIHTIKTVNIDTKINIIKFNKHLKINNIFVSECLTPFNYQLLKECKKLCRENVIISAWSKNGISYIKKNHDSSPIPIYNLSQLFEVTKLH